MLQTIDTKIKLVCIGGFGSQLIKSVSNKLAANVEIIAIDTDAQALLSTNVHKRLLIGENLVNGRGTGGDINIGRKAAEESFIAIKEEVKNADIVLILSGMGGGTGSGVSPIVASIAKENSALIIGIVTLPFQFEGQYRGNIARIGVDNLEAEVDTLITIPIEKLSKQDTALCIEKVVEFLNNTIYHVIQGLSDLLTTPGLINLDFADVRQIILQGKAGSISVGTAIGEQRAQLAAKKALSDFVGQLNILEAEGILFNITAGPNLSLFEVDEIAMFIKERAKPDGNFIFGAIMDPAMGDELNLTIIATGKTRKSPLANHQEEKLKNVSSIKSKSIDRQLKVFSVIHLVINHLLGNYISNYFRRDGWILGLTKPSCCLEKTGISKYQRL